MHKSVLLNECIQNLNLKDDSVIVDCTLGYGGHSSEILKRIPKGFLYAFDQDKEAIQSASQRLNEINCNYQIINDNFVNIDKYIIDKVDGVLFDLGVSSPQLDEEERGFSFHKDARLDMRMNREKELDAYKVVNEYSFDDLNRIIRDYGEEKYSFSIARDIVEKRKIKKIETTFELVDIIKDAVPMKYKREHHPARKTFQAIRIEVNDELNVFRKALTKALDLLKVNGRICVITFHSLEDKICKDIFNEVTKNIDGYKDMPIIPKELEPKFKKIKTIEPSKEELDENNRSRSAKLRVIEKIGE
ncbi:ribosomal RNA small subunit methyltransferase H 1 [Firmicutes bacterium CAG:884]|nr:ribosomal RNA small subunit methyltransferase H 1 [Firmicutes bacterium CAG:884]